MSVNVTGLFSFASSDLRHDVMSWNFHVSGAVGLGMSMAGMGTKLVSELLGGFGRMKKDTVSRTTDPCPDAVRVKGHRVEVMQASDV